MFIHVIRRKQVKNLHSINLLTIAIVFRYINKGLSVSHQLQLQTSYSIRITALTRNTQNLQYEEFLLNITLSGLCKTGIVGLM